MRTSPPIPSSHEKRAMIHKLIRVEEESFAKTIDQGIQMLSDILDRLDTRVITGEDAFRLNDTYGFPLDLTKEIAAERGFTSRRGGVPREAAGAEGARPQCPQRTPAPTPGSAKAICSTACRRRTSAAMRSWSCQCQGPRHCEGRRTRLASVTAGDEAVIWCATAPCFTARAAAR